MPADTAVVSATPGAPARQSSPPVGVTDLRITAGPLFALLPAQLPGLPELAEESVRVLKTPLLPFLIHLHAPMAAATDRMEKLSRVAEKIGAAVTRVMNGVGSPPAEAASPTRGLQDPQANLRPEWRVLVMKVVFEARSSKKLITFLVAKNLHNDIPV
jgi:hypothetical protein